MKKVLIAIVILAGISFTANAQSGAKKGKALQKKVEMKAHVCTDACNKEGHCVFKHGEKGHPCTAACKPSGELQPTAKEHVCTDACKNGQHMYLHGEKGHTCSEACKKEM